MPFGIQPYYSEYFCGMQYVYCVQNTDVQYAWPTAILHLPVKNSFDSIVWTNRFKTKLTKTFLNYSAVMQYAVSSVLIFHSIRSH